MYNIDKIWETVLAVLLAVLGGLARVLNLKDMQKLKWSKILSELFVSGFSGIMVLMLAHIYGLSGDWVGIICGMSGWIGPKILDILAKLVSKAIGIDVGGNEKKDDADSNK
jgi:hypothetical protein